MSQAKQFHVLVYKTGHGWHLVPATGEVGDGTFWRRHLQQLLADGADRAVLASVEDGFDLPVLAIHLDVVK